MANDATKNLGELGNLISVTGTTTTFSNAVQAPTPSAGDNSTNVATTAFVASGSVTKDSSTGAAQLPVGTTAQQPANGAGKIRFNADTSKFEGNTGSAWGSLGGGGATGGGSNAVFWENDASITSNYTITAGRNAGTFGPVSVADGVTVTVPSNSTWTVI